MFVVSELKVMMMMMMMMNGVDSVSHIGLNHQKCPQRSLCIGRSIILGKTNNVGLPVSSY